MGERAGQRARGRAGQRPVWLDARGLQRGFKEHGGRGIGTYVGALADALDAEAAPGAVGMIVERGADLLQSVSPQRLVEAPRAAGRGRLATHLHQQVQLAAWLSARRPAAVHFPAQTDPPAFLAVRSIVTVHDVVLHRHGAWYAREPSGAPRGRVGRLRFRLMRLLERLAIAHASRVIVPSRVTALEVAETLGVERARLSIIPLAASARFNPTALPSDAVVRARLRLPERYLLHTGGSDARKRLPELVRVFDALAKDDPALALVLVGPVASGDGMRALQRAIDAAAARSRIVLTGVLPEAELPAVYRGARALVLATRHEGFGLPVLEAFACGVPVVSTAADAVSEVAADAALLVDVEQVGALHDALRRVLHDQELASALAAAGRARSAQFRWSVNAAETLAVYDEVAGRAAAPR